MSSRHLGLFDGTGLSACDGGEDEAGEWRLEVDSVAEPFSIDVVLYGFLPKGTALEADLGKRWSTLLLPCDGNYAASTFSVSPMATKSPFGWNCETTWFQPVAFDGLGKRVSAGARTENDQIVEANVVRCGP